MCKSWRTACGPVAALRHALRHGEGDTDGATWGPDEMRFKACMAARKLRARAVPVAGELLTILLDSSVDVSEPEKDVRAEAWAALLMVAPHVSELTPALEAVGARLDAILKEGNADEKVEALFAMGDVVPAVIVKARMAGLVGRRHELDRCARTIALSLKWLSARPRHIERSGRRS